MANFNISVNSKFKPFSYAELIAPVHASTEAHIALEDAYSDMATKADVWKNIADETKDPKAYLMYLHYMDDLNKSVDILNSEGLLAASRNNMLDMKRRYSSEIVPIDIANTKRNTIDKLQVEASQKDPNVRYEKTASLISLDTLIDDPAYEPKHYSGTLVTLDSANMATNLTREIREDKTGKWHKILGGQFYEKVDKYGFSSEEVLNALSGSKEGLEALWSIMDSAVNTTGISNWDVSDEEKQRLTEEAYEFAKKGIWNAIGSDKPERLNNKAWDWWMRDKQTSKPPEMEGVIINPSNIYTLRERSDAELLAAQRKRDYSKYFMKTDDGYVLTKAGLDEFKKMHDEEEWYAPEASAFDYHTTGAKPNPGHASATLSLRRTVSKHSTFYLMFLDLLNKFGVKIEDTNDLGKIWTKYVTENPFAEYDAKKLTEYKYPVDKSNDDDIRRLIYGNTKNLYKVDFNKKTNKFERTGEVLPVSYLNNKGVEILRTNFSAYGNTFVMKDALGNTVLLETPSGINSPQEDNVRNSLLAATIYLLIINEGILYDINTGKPILDEKGKPKRATETDLRLAKQYKDRAVYDAHIAYRNIWADNSLGETNYKPQTQSVPPYYIDPITGQPMQ